MSERKVIVALGGSPDDARVIRMLDRLGVGWAHHLEEVWLIDDSQERDASWWRDWFIERGFEYVICVDATAGWAMEVPKGMVKWARDQGWAD